MDIASSAVNAVAATAAAHDSPARADVQAQDAALAQTASHGLYDPSREHDACGVGFVAHIKGVKAHDIVRQGLKILENLDHRGAVGAD